MICRRFSVETVGSCRVGRTGQSCGTFIDISGPDGEVVKGSKRKYTDNVAVAHLKRMLNAGKECQASLINYRRGGIPFINLITVVPIPWDGTDIVYHVGFQVDLVEQPNAILRNMRDGSYQVNYTVANPPPPVLRPPGREGGLGLSQEIIEIMGPRINMPGFGTGEEGGKMEWLKMALENADDFIHVLSLKGLFQYVSPSVRRVLEYEPEDLLNKNISDICHPSDIVPLMRELKDSTHAPADGNSARRVHLVFRIRRKSSGYVWIECTGRLHVEPGKGRKAVVLSGRALSVPTLSWDHVSRNGGLGENEGWMKVSFDGLILHATSTISDVVGINVDKLVGQSVFSLFPDESAALNNGHSTSSSHFASGLRNAANGDTRSAVVMRHYVMKRGTLVEVISIIYPPKTAELRSGTIDSDDSSVDSEMSDPMSSSSTSPSGVRPSSLIIQMRAASPPPSRAIVHPATANVFEELETTRGTSWQYELHQLRLLNRRLKEDIAVAKSKGKTVKSKKRKEGAGDGNMGPPPNPMFPDHYSAAPRHQLAPGFGLVAPGLSPFYS
ncbi:hypothetical protein DB88DRAFT_489058 [Papiliotrema laurentii]|uniref:PAS domain-containing protein n=1 Tax=Papiliotrema laurentii TaxID=5418 RepID=A0AAD9CXU2_PAPLA|nr:hypothetical protein DB88DRAFT_489058 [Papiliotrema laurentii]